MKEMTITLAGNPNSGKTTLFNNLTGTRQKVGNWPGVTVERKSGIAGDARGRIEVIDLPGLYGFDGGNEDGGLDEKVARDFLLSGEAGLIVNIVDAGNLERNLFLTLQLLDMRLPMVVALNKMDLLARRGMDIDCARLSKLLGCPVVAMAARQKQGMEDLLAAVRSEGERGLLPTGPSYPDVLETAVTDLQSELGLTRWPALQLLERMEGSGGPEGAAVSRACARLEAETGMEADLLIADARFSLANRLAASAVSAAEMEMRSWSDRLDGLFLHPIAGPVVFLGLMYLMFMFTINLGGAFIDFFDLTAAALFVGGLGEVMTAMGLPEGLRVLLAGGIGGGIQVVATFIPIIGFLYLFLGVLEDSGYMARAAFLMDRFMRRIGLPGKAFVPLIVGFGCNVPSITATRTLDRQRDRVMTAMMAPFMSCGARLAVYVLFAAAFFPSGGQNMVFALYLIGIAAAVLTGVFLKRTLLAGESTPFMMELPPYNMPRPGDVLIGAWVRLKSFLFGAGKVIVLVVAVLTLLNSLGRDGSFGHENSGNSVLSAIGRGITPLLQPLGIEEENWPASVGVFTGIFAKEAVVGTLDALYSDLAAKGAETEAVPAEPFALGARLWEAVETVPANLVGLADLALDPLGLAVADLDQAAAAEELQLSGGTLGAMAARFDGKAGAFAYLLFILLYTPCVATLGAIKRELGGGWTLFATLWTTGFAFAASIGFYQGTRLLEAPFAAGCWLAGIIFGIVAVFIILRRLSLRERRLAVGSARAAGAAERGVI